MALGFTLEIYVSHSHTAPEWLNITSDVVVSDGVTWSRGMQGTTLLDRCASSGSLTFTLKESRTARKYLPPGYVDGSDFTFGLLTPVRVTLSDGSTPTVVFRGTIKQVDYGTGPHRQGRRVRVMATDWLDDAATYRLSGLAAQVGKRPDEVLTTITTSNPPVATSFDTSAVPFAYALDNIEQNATTQLQVLAQIANSEYGYVYVTGAGTLRFESRTARAAATASIVTLTNEMVAWTPIITNAQRVGSVKAITHPRRVDTAATTVLFSRYNIANGQAALEIAAGATVTVFGPYGDPNNGNARCGGTAMVTPAASTDYTANAAAGGGGTDKTATLSVTASYTSSGVSLALQNTDTATIYVTKLQCRGKGIYDTTPVEVTNDIDAPLVTLDMPYQSDTNVGVGVAAQARNQWAGAQPGVVTFNALTSTRLTAAVVGEIGNRVTIGESRSSETGTFHIQAISQTLTSNKDLLTTWTLIPVQYSYWWVLDQTGGGEINSIYCLFY